MKHIKMYNEFNDPNLTLNNNPVSLKFDGGDGPSASELPNQYHINVNNPPKLKRGNNARRKQELRKNDTKEKAKEFKIAKLMDFQFDDDIIQFSPYTKRIDSNAGGATNI